MNPRQELKSIAHILKAKGYKKISSRLEKIAAEDYISPYLKDGSKFAYNMWKSTIGSAVTRLELKKKKTKEQVEAYLKGLYSLQRVFADMVQGTSRGYMNKAEAIRKMTEGIEEIYAAIEKKE